MDRRTDRRRPIHLAVGVRHREQFCSGHLCDITKTGVSIVSPLNLPSGELVQLDFADSVLFAHVVYSRPDGQLFRTGLELVQVLLGGTDLSSLLQSILKQSVPDTPGLESAVQANTL